MSTILPEIRLYLPAYRNHLTITSIFLLYYKRHNCTNPPTATTLALHPPVYHTTRDTTVLTCLQQPSYNNIHLSTILPETRLYLPVYKNHLTITPTCQPYYQKHNYTYLLTATTSQKHPPVYHTTRDTIVLFCLQQPPFNNIHLSTILPETQPY